MQPITAALTTMHGKEQQIAPAFGRIAGWELVVAQIDTDQFGSFDGEVPRTLSPKAAALAKAKLGAEQLGLRFGVASEGTIGHHPQFPLLTSDHELIAIVDLELGHELVVSHVSAEIIAERHVLSDDSNLEQIASLCDLPNHAANLIASGPSGREVRKDIRDLANLKLTVRDLGNKQDLRELVVESDFRAMSSPSRQRNIEHCAELAAQRVATRCPGCEYLGWGLVRYEFGLECRSCGFANEHLAKKGINRCLRCELEESFDLGVSLAEPAQCMVCNP